MFPGVFALYNKAKDTFSLLQCEEQDGKIVRLKQWSRPDYSVWKASEDDEKIRLMPWMTGQEWFVVSSHNQQRNVGQVEIHSQNYNYSVLPYELIWSNYIIHRGRNSYTQKEWDTAPAVPIVELSSRRILPRELAEVHARWSEVSQKLFKHVVEKEGSSMMYPLLPSSDVEEEHEDDESDSGVRRRRHRSWSDVSDMLEEEIEETCCSKRAIQGCALLSVSLVSLLWVITIPMIILGA